MQATPSAQPAATAPAGTQGTPPTVTIVGADGKSQTLPVPASRAEVRQLLNQREQISDQLSNVASRRRELAEEIRATPEGVTRTGLEERLRVMDQRIVQLETDLATTGQQLAAASTQLVASTEAGSGGGGDNFDEGFLAGGFTALFLIPVAVLYARRRWKRKLAGLPSRLPADPTNRLERLEQGMEAIAIEIERVSEGQRFVTKLLSESRAPVGAQQRIEQPEQLRHGESSRG